MSIFNGNSLFLSKKTQNNADRKTTKECKAVPADRQSV